MNVLSADRLERLRQLQLHLSDRIRGQNHVIPRVVSVLQRGELRLTTPNRPRGSFLFLGPTGVGKTELSLAFTDYLLGKDKLFRFDMSEYQTQDSLGVLLGGRVGEIGLLGMAVAKSATGTLLFDGSGCRRITSAADRDLLSLPSQSNHCRFAMTAHIEKDLVCDNDHFRFFLDYSEQWRPNEFNRDMW